VMAWLLDCSFFSLFVEAYVHFSEANCAFLELAAEVGE
jgi:hypothetical protein